MSVCPSEHLVKFFSHLLAACENNDWAHKPVKSPAKLAKSTLEPQTKLASLWSGTWKFGLPTVLLLIVWQQRPLWQMSPSITPLCFPLLPVTVPAQQDEARAYNSIFGLHGFCYCFFCVLACISFSLSYFAFSAAPCNYKMLSSPAPC